MRALRERAERTPATRERYLDLLRAIAIAAVVLGHWLVSAIGYDGNGRPTGYSALPSLPWAFPVTWVAQVMPLFFIVGGYANATSLTSHRDRGGDGVTWLQERTARLIRPTTVLLVVLAGSALTAQGLDADQRFTRMAVWVASIPLWFLSAYLAVVLTTPVMHRLHRRFGLRVLPVLVALVGLGDVARLTGAELLGAGNFIFGWVAVHQLGFAWRDGQLRFGARTWIPLLVGGLAVLVLLTTVGPYPVTMIDVPGQRLLNASPPSLALLAATAFQLGLVVLLRDPAQRWLRRPRAWLAVVAVNAVVLTIFLWHMSAVVLLVGLLDALHALPTPAVPTPSWWLWRLPWLAMLTAVLAVLIAVFARVEARPRTVRRQVPWPAWLTRGLTIAGPRFVLTVLAFLAIIAGLLSNNLAPRTGVYAVGMPAVGLATYLAGAGTMRLLRSVRSGADAETHGPPATPR